MPEKVPSATRPERSLSACYFLRDVTLVESAISRAALAVQPLPRTRRGVSTHTPLLRPIVLLAVAVLAGKGALADVPDSGDTSWVMMSTVLVLFMTIPGLALFYGGLVRASSVLSVLMQCLAITCVVTLLWVAVGYSLTFGDDGFVIGDFSRVLFHGIESGDSKGGVPEGAFALFQMTFAIIAPALVVGAFAERMRFGAVLGFAMLWSLAVYVPLAHWVWGGGWLAQVGVMDFSGGLVVHLAAGMAALVAALTVGSRRGYPGHVEPPHNMPLAVTGAAMLWIGWLGFNGGSALAADGDAVRAMIATHISAAAGMFSWMALEWKQYDKPSALGAVTGVIAGLGTITPAAGYVSPAAALLVGLCAGTVCYFATQLMNLKFQVDDTLDVFAVHGVGGALGTILCGVFASNALGGLFAGSESIQVLSQLRIQFLGVVLVAVYSSLVTYVILRITNLFGGNRVSETDEAEGLDVVSHNERGYAL